MKRIILVLSVFLMGCSLFASTPEIYEMAFVEDEGSVAPSFFNISSLEIFPNYEARELNVSLNIEYPYRDEETLEEDFNGNGKVAGEYFDRFEDIVEAYYEGEFEALDERILLEIEEKGACMGSGGMHMSIYEALEAEAKNADIDPPALCGEFEDELQDMVENFYKDLVELLNEEIRI